MKGLNATSKTNFDHGQFIRVQMIFVLFAQRIWLVTTPSKC